MTGLELFKVEMRKRGLTENQINSKGVAVALDILSESSGTYLHIKEAEDELEELRRHIEFLKREQEHKRLDFERMKKELYEERQEFAEYVERFNDSMQNAETPEARDQMRKLQLFINTVDIDTKYDNTAFIAALGAILSGGPSPLEELKKINPSAFGLGRATLGRV